MSDIKSFYEVVGDVIIVYRVNFTERTAFIKVTLPDEQEYIMEDFSR